MRQFIADLFVGGIKRKTDNHLPFTKRERYMVKWFLKFEIITIIVVAAWYLPARSLYLAYQETKVIPTTFQPAIASSSAASVEVIELPVKEVKVEVIETPKKELTAEQIIREEAAKAGTKHVEYLVRLAKCESSLNPKATGVNKSGSRDRGLFQINDKFHPEVSDECAYDARCATRWTIWRIDSGHQNEWVCDKLI